jgi:pimeloyl-ACP methyl ester carboxylesterase
MAHEQQAVSTVPSSIPGRLAHRRRWPRRLGIVVLVILLVVVVGPFLVPLPATADRPAEEVARDLGQSGSLVDVDGTRVWVEEAGPADGPPIVLVHGFGGSTWSWRETVPALADAGYRVVALDLANFGLSDKSWDRDTSHARQADLVAGVLDELGIDGATIVGHSMGANVLAWLAARHPERVERAVLVDAATGPAAADGGGPLGALLQLPNVRRIGQLLLRSVVDEKRLGGILGSAYADPSRATPGALAGYAAALRTAGWDDALLAIVRDGGADAPPAPIGELLRVPTLVVWGREDGWIPLADGEALRAALPDAEWRIIDDAGHLPMEEQPADFNATLLAWLESTR